MTEWYTDTGMLDIVEVKEKLAEPVALDPGAGDPQNEAEPAE
ncbi:hypothetical protein [Glutamicibacter mysorens]|nr:hypothetical protein [Glutamicibacter mysorens]